MAEGYPSRSEVWNAVGYNDHIVAQAPWFCVDGVQQPELLAEYADDAGTLPGGLSLDIIQTFDWRRRLIVHESLLRGDAVPYRTGVANLTFITQRQQRTPCSLLIPGAYQMDTWAYRTLGEISYVDYLAELGRNVWWSTNADPDSDLLCWSEPLLPGNFAHRDEAPGFWEKLRFERNARNRLGYLIAYPWVEANHLRTSALFNRYPAVPGWWEEWEVRIGFRAELPPSVYYLGSELMRHPVNSPWWAVVRTEWTVIVGKRFLWAASQGKLFLLPTLIVEGLSALDLAGIYGGTETVAAMNACLEAHGQVDWWSVPPGDLPDGRGRQPSGYVNNSPGGGFDAGHPNGGYWVHFDWGTKTVTDDEYLLPTVEPATQNGNEAEAEPNLDS